MSARPVRTVVPTSRLVDPNNAETGILSSHRQAVVSAQVALQQNTVPSNLPLPTGTVQPSSSHIPPLQTPEINAALPPSASPISSQQQNTSNKRAQSVEISSSDEDEAPAASLTAEKPRKKKKRPRKDPRKSHLNYLICDANFSFICTITETNPAVDNDGMHLDVHVISIDDEDTTKVTKLAPTADVKHFFKPLPHTPNGPKARSRCVACT